MKTKAILKAGIDGMQDRIDEAKKADDTLPAIAHLLEAIAIYFRTSLEANLDEVSR